MNMKTDPYALHPQCRPTQGPRPCVGDPVYVQNTYDLNPGCVVKLNKTTATVAFNMFGYVPHERRVPYEKIALPDEPIACICEYWRGSGNTPGYRIDRHLHAKHLLPAKRLPHQGYLCEKAPGQLDPSYSKADLLAKAQNQAQFFSGLNLGPKPHFPTARKTNP